jgi:hypothetical protein
MKAQSLKFNAAPFEPQSPKNKSRSLKNKAQRSIMYLAQKSPSSYPDLAAKPLVYTSEKIVREKKVNATKVTFIFFGPFLGSLIYSPQTIFIAPPPCNKKFFSEKNLGEEEQSLGCK